MLAKLVSMNTEPHNILMAAEGIEKPKEND
jgi:hypothetical protein